MVAAKDFDESDRFNGNAIGLTGGELTIKQTCEPF